MTLRAGRMIAVLVASTASCLFSDAGAAGPSINQFEIKDVESSPGDWQFQSQNAISFKQPKRQIRGTEPDALTFDDNTIARERYALELQAGITSWFRGRVGIEFEKERLDDPGSVARANAFDALRLTGVAIEGVFVVIPAKPNRIGAGLLVEYDAAIGAGVDQVTIGPIFQASYGPWSALTNLAIVQTTSSPDQKRDFTYAAQLQYTLSSRWAIALEAYGTVERIGKSGTPSPEKQLFGDFDQHRIGPIVYYRFKTDGDDGDRVGVATQPSLPGRTRKGKKSEGDGDDDKQPSVSLGVGVLFGLNGATPGETLKLSLEYNF